MGRQRLPENTSGHSSSEEQKEENTSASSSSSEQQKTFRCQASAYAITYPQCSVERAVFDPIFKSLFNPVEFASAREQHQDGSWHLHVYCNYKRRHEVSNARYFDVSVEGDVFHPNVQGCRNRRQWLEYLCKGNDTNARELLEGSGSGSRNNHASSQRRSIPSIENDGQYHIDAYQYKDRQRAYDGYTFTQQYREREKLKEINWPVKLEYEAGLNTSFYEMHEPDPRIKRRSWWIVSPPNSGKSRWINDKFAFQKVYCPRTGPYPFEGYDGESIIIYDDREPEFAEVSNVLNTWNIIMPVWGQVRYKTQNWPLGQTRNVIVLSNKRIENAYEEADVERMRKRFIQIINAKLCPPEVDEEDNLQNVAERAAFAVLDAGELGFETAPTG